MPYDLKWCQMIWNDSKWVSMCPKNQLKTFEFILKNNMESFKLWGDKSSYCTINMQRSMSLFFRVSQQKSTIVWGPVLSNWNPLIHIPTAVEAHSFSKKAPKRNRYIPQSNDLQSSSIYKLVSVLEFWSTKFLIFRIW